jgi:hypothetical protein
MAQAGQDAIGDFMPLLVQHKVDMYIAGHWHSYETLWPAKPGPTGCGLAPLQYNFTDPPFPVHVTSGNAGAPSIDQVDERHCGNVSGSTTIPSTRSNSLLPGYGLLTAHNSTHLTWQQIRNSYRSARGDVGRALLDEFTVVRTLREQAP